MTVTVDRVREMLRYSPIVGVFEWRKPGRRRRLGGLAGGVTSTGYIRIVLDGKPYPAHRLAWLYMTGQWPEKDIDHIDGDRSNNAWNNLREATYTTNGWNKPKARNNRTGVKGVGRRDEAKPWQARVQANGIVWSASYATREEAEEAVRVKREELHGEFTNHGEHIYQVEERAD